MSGGLQPDGCEEGGVILGFKELLRASTLRAADFHGITLLRTRAILSC